MVYKPKGLIINENNPFIASWAFEANPIQPVGLFWLMTNFRTFPPVFFPHDKNKNSHLKWAIEEERGFWAIEIPNKATGCLTYKLVLFIPSKKQTKWKTENNHTSFGSKAWFNISSTKKGYLRTKINLYMDITHRLYITIITWSSFLNKFYSANNAVEQLAVTDSVREERLQISLIRKIPTLCAKNVP